MRTPFLALPLLFLVAGCTTAKGDVPGGPGGPELKPEQFRILGDREKLRYKNILIRVPNTWGGAQLPLDKGPFPSAADKAIHGGDLANLMGIYNQSLFELQHPRVRVEYINFDMWSDNFRSALAVALAGHRAPAYYIARDLPQTIEQGMYADLTPLMKKWDQFKLQPEGSIRQGTVSGRIYTLAGNELGATVIRYRKDWFREAGILNEHGEPGPRSDWTWDDFRAIARKLTDPKRGRYGYSADMGDFLYNQAHGLEPYIPDPEGKRTWIFNDRDPDMLRSLQAARELYAVDKSVLTSVTAGWFEYHGDFDGGRAAMIQSFSPHIAREFLDNPNKFGRDRPYADTVGMAAPPRTPTGLSSLKPVTNPIGFDPTLTPAQLDAAFEWCKSWFYGDSFINRMRAAAQEARTLGRKSSIYAELLVLPYQPTENLLDRSLEEVFPANYTRLYKTIREGHAPPLPREFGLQEPATNEFNKAVKALYSDAITTDSDLKAILAKHASLINTTLMDFRGPNDGEALRAYVAALTEFYRRYYPRYYRADWQEKLQKYYEVP
jgi:ABC-type glycerol-3-phosphate transport system substrate-binding protein